MHTSLDYVDSILQVVVRDELMEAGRRLRPEHPFPDGTQRWAFPDVKSSAYEVLPEPDAPAVPLIHAVEDAEEAGNFRRVA